MYVRTRMSLAIEYILEFVFFISFIHSSSFSVLDRQSQPSTPNQMSILHTRLHLLPRPTAAPQTRLPLMPRQQRQTLSLRIRLG